MVVSSLYVELCFISPKFLVVDLLTQKVGFSKLALVYFRILMTLLVAVFRQSYPDKLILRNVIMLGLLLILFSRTIQEFPFKNHAIQKISGSLLLFTTLLAVMTLVYSSFKLADRINPSFLHLFLLTVSIKLFSLLFDSTIRSYICNYKTTVATPRQFFILVEYLSKYEFKIKKDIQIRLEIAGELS